MHYETEQPLKQINLFDKICAVAALLLGIIFVLFGTLGAIFGCNMWFALPPILGGLPVFFGWGIIRCIYVSWYNSILLKRAAAARGARLARINAGIEPPSLMEHDPDGSESDTTGQ
jgi:predicted permease